MLPLKRRHHAAIGDIALKLVEDVLESLKNTTGWKKIKMALDGMILTLEKEEAQKKKSEAASTWGIKTRPQNHSAKLRSCF